MTKRMLLVAVLGLFALARPEASAEEAAPARQGPPEAQASDAWKFELVPMYLWAMGIDGTMGVKGMTMPVDTGFSDLLDSVEFIGTARIEGHRGRWGFFIDGTYVTLAQEIDDISLPKPSMPKPSIDPSGKLIRALASLPPPLRRRALRNILGKLKAAKAKLASLRMPTIDEIDIEVTLAIIEAGMAFRCFELPLGSGQEQALIFEALGGARYTYMKTGPTSTSPRAPSACCRARSPWRRASTGSSRW
ncbi:hypothetical protein HQ576_03535 [bacterium]|nr:hypothetical protein [bacterium]